MFDNLTPQPNNNPAGKTASSDNENEVNNDRPPSLINEKSRISGLGSSELEDIFAGTENQSVPSGPTAAMTSPAANLATPPGNHPLPPTSPQMPVAETPKAMEPEWSKKMIIGIIVVFVLIVILVGMMVLAYFKSASFDENLAPLDNAVPADTGADSSASEADLPGDVMLDANLAGDNMDDKISENENTGGVSSENAGDAMTPPVDDSMPSTEGVFAEALDSDNDGLSDAEEARLGTDINSADTDNDGLFDREETYVYITNPVNSDTDGDGFSDGEEVRNGYNPNGEGKLYELPEF